MLNIEQGLELKKLKSLLPHIVQKHENIEEIMKAQAENEAKEALRKKKHSEKFGFSRAGPFTSCNVIPSPHRRNPFPEIIREREFDARSGLSRRSSDSASIPVPAAEGVNGEFYEEWMLTWTEGVRHISKSWSFFGLRVNYHEEIEFWRTDSEHRTVEEMKEQEKFASADKSPAKHKAAMQKIVQGLPNKGGIAIDRLLDDRTNASSHADGKREWSVVAVRPKQKYPYSSAKKWDRDPKTTDWLITIKGMAIDTNNRTGPSRRDNPWLKRCYSPRRTDGRYRSSSPPPRAGRGRLYSEVIRVAERDRSPEFRPVPVMRDPARSPSVPCETHIEDGYNPGKFVVGMMMTNTEAEWKIVAIWEEMTSKTAEKRAQKVDPVAETE